MNYPKRKTIRLQDFDYSSNGAYFVTVCTQGHRCLFWEWDQAVLNTGGTMVFEWLSKLPGKFPGVELDCCAVMPNHVHMLLFLEQSQTSLDKVVSWFKTMTTNAYIRGVKIGLYPSFDKQLWQRSYYEHVIRNEQDLRETRNYISENPLKWQLDHLYTE